MTRTRRKIRDAADARSCLDLVARSGLSRSRWARENDVDGRSLNMWRVILDQKKGGEVVPLRLVEVVGATPKPASTYLVHVDRYAVEVDDRFDSDVLRRLVGVLAAC